MTRCAHELCDGSGLRFDDATNTAYPCDCRSQVIAHNKARSLHAVIPARYKYASFDRPPVSGFDGIDPNAVRATRDFVERIDHHLDRGHGLWYMGSVGNGKTTLAMLAAKAALDAGRTVAIYSLPRLLNVIRDGHRAERSHLDLLDRLTAVDLLHLDDVGAERTTDWVLEVLYSIVNARYEEQRSMVITTNILNPDELCEQIHERTVSRLTEMCDQIFVQGDDRRGDRRWESSSEREFGQQAAPPQFGSVSELTPRRS
jgi:DNA replication protein DnaC